MKLIGNSIVKNQKKEDKILDKPTLKLKKELLRIIRKNTKEKNLQEKIVDTYKKLKQMIMLKNIKMPCLFGNCNIGDKIKKERDAYEKLHVKNRPKTKMNSQNVFVSDELSRLAEQSEDENKKPAPTL